jgi:hypothetical protein
MPARKKAVRRKKAAPGSVGLTASETGEVRDESLDRLAGQVERDGGAVLGRYRDPFGATPLLLAALPVDRVEPTPYQRDPSAAHVKRLMGVIESIGRFLDPIIAVRRDDQYWTPNGNHRLQALKKLSRWSSRTLRWRSRFWRSIPRRRTTSVKDRWKRSGWRARSPKRATRTSRRSRSSSSSRRISRSACATRNGRA